MVALMPPKKPWAVDDSGNVDTGVRPSAWRSIKWGQLLSFGAGAFCMFVGLEGDGYDKAIRAAGILMTLGIAFRVIDVWKSKN
jgi:hypothetical protein